ncbi:MAG: single-stranded DNA-binding protein [Oscillospiraceae bacterium]|jgi:single-strand DNA-binding protein|nr:single-stranded DNA-binding protein [Oscillospiraceae bacterium]
MLNVAIIMGRLTADPELRRTGGGIDVCTFRVAVDRRFKGQNEERQADFINVVAWRQTAEFVSRFFRKGSMIAVQGSIQTRNYEDKSGNRREAVEIVAENVSFTGGKNEGGGGGYGGDIPLPPPPPSTGAAPQDRGQGAAPPAPAFATGSAADFDEIAGEDDLPF